MLIMNNNNENLPMLRECPSCHFQFHMDAKEYGSDKELLCPKCDWVIDEAKETTNNTFEPKFP